MKTNLEALKAVYVKNGGSLTDTYEDIAGGAPVSAYKTLKDAIAALSKLTLGGGGSGLPDVTAADNGKTLQVEEGEWTVKDADYIRTTVFFSGNATVVDVYGSPEIDLGQIEGLDFSVKTVELTMEKDGQTKAVTLVCDSFDPIWTGNDGENTYELTDAGGYIALHSSLFNESVVGEVYSITLSTESVEPNFKVAVAKTVEGLNKTIDVSLTQADFLQLVTSGYATIDITSTAREWDLNEDNALSYYIGLVLPDGTIISLEPVGMWGQSSVRMPNYRAWVFDFGYSTSPKNLNLIYAHILFGGLVSLYVETGHVAVTAGLATN